MAAVVRPSTPVNQPTYVPSTPQTGTWKHPRFDEIARRQNASTFSDRNLKKLLYNVGGLIALWILERLTRSNVYHAAEALQPYSNYFYICIRAVLIFNMFMALRPLLHRKDDLSDIPLTPAQRRLLGLPQSDTPPTPGSRYITPPRYPRSTTPQSGSPSNIYTPSPLSGKSSPTPGTPKGSPFSPSASPLLNRTIGGGLAVTKRSTYGSPSPLGPGPVKANWFDGPATPIPSAGKGPSVSLNNKWLWEKGKRSSGDARIFS